MYSLSHRNNIQFMVWEIKTKGRSGMFKLSHMSVAIKTVAVLGHGLDRLYPYLNKSLSEKSLKMQINFS